MKEIHKALKNNNWRQGSCLYIEIGDVSVADYFDLDSWDFEYLSFRD